MTRTGPAKPVGKDYGEGRLKLARAYLKAAQDEATLADDGAIGNPIISQVVIAAIAYTDALTARFGGRANQKDHNAAVKALRDVLGKRFPLAQASRLRRILAEKDDVQYGFRAKSKAEAEQLLRQLTDFAAWVEAELNRV